MIPVDPLGARAHPSQPSPDNPFVEFARGEIEHGLHRRFERLAESCAERSAVITRTERVTYRTLNARANRVAHAIVGRAGPQAEPVVLLFHQGLPSIIATLATLKAGKFYMPADPRSSAQPLARLVEESGARLVLTESRHLDLARQQCGHGIDLLDVDRIGADVPDHNLGLADSPDALAYVYYTSGSTGIPKGVMDTHRNVLHNIMRYTNRLHVCADDRMTLLQNVAFSGAVSSLFSALLNGACVFPVELQDETPRAVASWLAESGITIYHSVPALFRALLTERAALPAARLIRLEGDRASMADVELYRRHCASHCLLVNGLGTTETGIASQYFVDRATSIEDGVLPIGYPTEDMQIRIVDEEGHPLAAPGRVGEIAVVSRYLSPGYWRNPTLTQRAFTPDPDDARARVYRTGDLGRFRSDGCLEHLGRNDGRVKVRGHWVTFADVESALLAMDEVREAAVTAHADEDGESRVAAYVVARDGDMPSASELRRRLAARLPTPMIPARFVVLEALPLSRNGKIDRNALAPPPAERPTLDHAYRGPESLLQIRIAQVWEEILGVQPVGIRDNFFDLGGHSLQAARMVDRLAEIFDRTIPLSVLFEAADVEGLADVLFHQSGDLRFPLLHVQPEGSKPPLFFLHGDYLSGGFYCLELARHLGPDQPFYALPPYGLDDRPIPTSYELMAAQHLDTLRAFRPRGPYRLGGTCNGGLVAFEMARQLAGAGHEVDLLALIGSSAENVRFRPLRRMVAGAGAWLGLPTRFEAALYEHLRGRLLELSERSLQDFARQLLAAARRTPLQLAHRLRATLTRGRETAGGPDLRIDGGTARAQRERLRKTYLRIDRLYIPGDYGNPVTLFWPEDDPQPAAEAAGWWGRVAPRVDLHVIRGTHLGSLTADVKTLAEHLRRCLGP